MANTYVALYLQYIGEISGSKSAVKEAVHAIAWIHSAAGVHSPISSPLSPLYWKVYADP